MCLCSCPKPRTILTIETIVYLWPYGFEHMRARITQKKEKRKKEKEETIAIKLSTYLESLAWWHNCWITPSFLPPLTSPKQVMCLVKFFSVIISAFIFPISSISCSMWPHTYLHLNWYISSHNSSSSSLVEVTFPKTRVFSLWSILPSESIELVWALSLPWLGMWAADLD